MRSLSLTLLIVGLQATLLAQPSVTPSPYLGFWAPLDEPSGSTFLNIAKKPVSGAHQGNPAVTAGKVDLARDYDGATQYSDYPDAPEANAMSPGKRFTLECWIKPNGGAGLSGIRAIADKRANDGTGLRGYAFFLYNGALACQIADGGYDNYISNLTLQPGVWQHVALTVDRNPSGISFLYVDGVAWGFDCTSHPGSLKSSAPLRIGARTVSGGGHFSGAIDELSLYGTALTAGQIGSLHTADSWGKSKSRCSLPYVVGFASNQSCAGITGRIYNDHVVSKTYSWTLQPAAANTVSPSCLVAGPPSFSPATGSVTVPPCSFVDVSSTASPPAATGQAGCYTMICHEGGDTFWSYGHAYRSSLPISASPPCSGVGGGATTLLAGVNRFGTGAFSLSNGGGQSVSFNYRIEVRTPEGLPDFETVALEGDLPGAAVNGVMSLAPGQTATVPIAARFIRRDPRRDYSLVLFEDSTGTMQPSGNVRIMDALPAGQELELATPAPGHFDLRLFGGVSGNPVYAFFTPDVAAAPRGHFFGIDLSTGDFQFQFGAAAAGIAPFRLVPDAAGRATWTATGFPPGIPLAAVALSLDPAGLGILTSSVSRLITQ